MTNSISKSPDGILESPHEHRTRFIANSKITYHNKTGKKHIAVVCGGMSAEHKVSLASSKLIIESLIKLGYRVTSIDMGADIANALVKINPDVVFNCLHGTYGEDGCIAGLLNILRIPYTHSGVLASALGFNKVKSKELFAKYGLLTANQVIINKQDKIKHEPMPRPYVIKPINQGSSIGVEVIFEGDDFNFTNYNFPYGDEIIVERYIKGREMQVAVLNGKALGALELKFLKRRFYDYDTKYTEGLAQHILPADLSRDKYNELLNLAEKANTAIMAKGLTRVEFILDEKENFIILEINTQPGFTPESICPEIAAFAGISFDKLIEEVLSSACFEE